jgi:hypothetical protein
VSENHKNLPNAERLATALAHLVTCIREAPSGSPSSALPLKLATEALDAWRGYVDGALFVAAMPLRTVLYQFDRCPTCEHTTVLEVPEP